MGIYQIFIEWFYYGYMVEAIEAHYNIFNMSQRNQMVYVCKIFLLFCPRFCLY